MQAPLAAGHTHICPMPRDWDMVVTSWSPGLDPLTRGFRLRNSRETHSFGPILGNAPDAVPRTRCPWDAMLPSAVRRCRVPRSARFGQIHRGGAAIGLLFNLKREFLPLVERSHPRFLDGTDMDEDVLAALFGADEAIAFGCVEPLHGACGHRLLAFPVTGGPFRTSSQTTLLHRGATANRDALPW